MMYLATAGVREYATYKEGCLVMGWGSKRQEGQGHCSCPALSLCLGERERYLVCCCGCERFLAGLLMSRNDFVETEEATRNFKSPGF